MYNPIKFSPTYKMKKNKTKSEKLSELFQEEKEVDIEDIDYGDIRKYEAQDFESFKKPSKKVKEVSSFRNIQDEEEEYKGKPVKREELENSEEDSDFEEEKEEAGEIEEDFEDGLNIEGEEEEEINEREDLDIFDDEDMDEIQKIKQEIDQSKEYLERNEKEEIETHLKKLESKEIIGNIQEERRKEKQKAMNVFNQKVLYDSLLKLRILVQKPLLTVNRFPQGKTLKEFENNEDVSKNIDKVKNSLFETINDLVDLQNELVKSNPDVKCPLIEKKYDKNLEKLWESIEQQNKNFEEYRNSSLENWNRKTKLGNVNAKNFKTINQVRNRIF